MFNVLTKFKDCMDYLNGKILVLEANFLKLANLMYNSVAI